MRDSLVERAAKFQLEIRGVTGGGSKFVMPEFERAAASNMTIGE